MGMFLQIDPLVSAACDMYNDVQKMDVDLVTKHKASLYIQQPAGADTMLMDTTLTDAILTDTILGTLAPV